MKKLLFVVVLSIIMLTGCAQLASQVKDDSSTLNKTVDTASQAAIGVNAAGTAATAAGLPWGWILTLAGGLVTVATGEYRNYKKKLVITEQGEDYDAVAMTTKAIVDAIERLGSVPVRDSGSVADVVKAKVSDELKNNDIYKIGKAVISGLKS